MGRTCMCSKHELRTKVVLDYTKNSKPCLERLLTAARTRAGSLKSGLVREIYGSFEFIAKGSCKPSLTKE